VAAKDAKTNTVVVAEGSDNPALLRKEVELTGVYLINPLFVNSIELTNNAKKSIKTVNRLIRANKTSDEMEVYVRVRYRQPLFRARIKYQVSGIRLIFEKPQRFIAPGQSAVWYSKKGEMLGGGVII
jgi:tRNA-specific 2-thiouridylase